MFDFLKKYILPGSKEGDGSALPQEGLKARQKPSIDPPPVSMERDTWPDAAELGLPSRGTINLDQVSLRPYQPSDSDTLLLVERAPCETNRLRELKELLSRVEKKEISCVVANHRGSIAGFIIHQRTGNGYELRKIAVDAGYQRNGIGNLLVRYVTDILSDIDDMLATTISAKVQEQNLDAQMFFHHLGFGGSIVKTDGGNDDIKYLFRYRPTVREIKRKKVEIQTKCSMRGMLRSDTNAVLAIEKGSFTSQLSEGVLLKALRQQNFIFQVVELDQKILGYIIFEVYDDLYVIKRMAVDPDMRRLGIGSNTLEEMKNKLSPGKHSALILEIDATNDAGHSCLRKANFKADAVIRKDRPSTTDYVFRMKYTLPLREGAADQSRGKAGSPCVGVASLGNLNMMPFRGWMSRISYVVVKRRVRCFRINEWTRVFQN